MTSKGEGGGCPNFNNNICLFSKLVNEGGEGVKNPQISVNVVYGCPLKNVLDNKKHRYVCIKQKLLDENESPAWILGA